ARNQALERAVTAARREAEAVAAAAGQRLGEPLNITTSTMYPEPRPMMMDAIMARQAAVETPIESGTLTVRATVNIVYKLEPR
ncbi:MAG: SIMPL domain-containing protein, partial [Gemmatimonadetes bacterium]|nr:SIMPL domain-containing protein [Gemmatimonadota bacterium]